VNIYPWQTEIWAQLMRRRDALPHAMLLHGAAGIGKRHLAAVFGQSLLCRTPLASGEPCGRCQACRWVEGGNHPDFRVIQPEAAEALDGDGEVASSSRKPSKMIRIEQIRALQDWLGVGAHQGGLRVAILQPAESMNVATANASLKTLEEPPPGVILLLVSHAADRLLPTIRSRCQGLAVPNPDAARARAWLGEQGVEDPANTLALAGGAPLTALERPELVALARGLVEDLAGNADPLELAARYQGAALLDVIDLLQRWTFDLAATIAGIALRYYPNSRAALDRASRGVTIEQATRCARRLAEARRVAEHPLAPRLVLEELFLAIMQMKLPAAPTAASRT
jgi:DNA polymerase III subunit delta'